MIRRRCRGRRARTQQSPIATFSLRFRPVERTDTLNTPTGNSRWELSECTVEARPQRRTNTRRLMAHARTHARTPVACQMRMGAGDSRWDGGGFIQTTGDGFKLKRGAYRGRDQHLDMLMVLMTKFDVADRYYYLGFF